MSIGDRHSDYSYTRGVVCFPRNIGVGGVDLCGADIGRWIMPERHCVVAAHNVTDITISVEWRLDSEVADDFDAWVLGEGLGSLSQKCQCVLSDLSCKQWVITCWISTWQYLLFAFSSPIFKPGPVMGALSREMPSSRYMTYVCKVLKLPWRDTIYCANTDIVFSWVYM